MRLCAAALYYDACSKFGSRINGCQAPGRFQLLVDVPQERWIWSQICCKSRHASTYNRLDPFEKKGLLRYNGSRVRMKVWCDHVYDAGEARLGQA